MNLMLNTVTPLYEQIKISLKKRIDSGEFDENKRLPSEGEIAQDYHVSIITSRRAITELVKENIVERKQGKGTFILKPKFQKNLQTVLSFSDSCRMSGMVPGSKTLNCKKMNITKELLEKLELDSDAKNVIELSRVRFADNEPIAVETNFFSDEFHFLLSEDLNNKELLKTIREKRGWEVYHTRREISIKRASSEDAKHLNVVKGFPLLQINSTSYDRSEKVLFCGTQLINSDRFQIVV